MKSYHQFGRWELLTVVAMILFSALMVFLFVKFVPKKSKGDYEDLLVRCDELIANYSDINLNGISPKFAISGGGGVYGYSQDIVFWKNENFDVDVKCIGHKRNKSDELKIDSFVVNGEDLTELVRLEEQKK